MQLKTPIREFFSPHDPLEAGMVSGGEGEGEWDTGKGTFMNHD